MSAAVVDLIGDLLRDRPALDAPHTDRVAWLYRKADILDAIAAHAAEEPGLVDAAEAREVAAKARVQAAAVASGSGS